MPNQINEWTRMDREAPDDVVIYPNIDIPRSRKSQTLNGHGVCCLIRPESWTPSIHIPRPFCIPSITLNANMALLIESLYRSFRSDRGGPSCNWYNKLPRLPPTLSFLRHCFHNSSSIQHLSSISHGTL
jgi:hypothetical protein